MFESDSKKRFSLLGGTRAVQNDIDLFFSKIGDGTTLFVQILRYYFEAKPLSDRFTQTVTQLDEVESQADDLRRGIESYLYEKTLIPDLRSDVLLLIEDVDKLLSPPMSVSYALQIETPEVPAELHGDFIALGESTARCVNHLLDGARAFFRDTEAVRDHCHLVVFEESQADRLSSSLKQAVFNADLDKAEKLHLRYFIERIDLLANRAEDIADALVIYALKRLA